ncbi:membrane protein insertion efficiency factor YidD [Candidatus Shapirobacteria bacterium]|nr:MAG: membrane protein insertion efficiency factor YidD [Candidatus Shapirobacteria bacterium]
MSRLLILLVRFYQVCLNPAVRFFFGNCCRFEPSCSNYMIQAIKKYGPMKGVFKGICRLFRCHPFCKGGYDPP